MTDQFPSNSNSGSPKAAPPPKEATPEKKVNRITQGEAVRRKKPLGRRFRDIVVRMDPRAVWDSVVGDVLLPAAKDMVADAGREYIERAVFGESRNRPRGRHGGPTRYDGYARPSHASTPAWKPAHSEPRREFSRRARSTHSFDEIILDSRGEAEQVLDTLRAIIEQYNQASVSDLYEMVGITAAYTDQKYGWTSLLGARVEHVRGGAYLLDLPRPEPLEP